jgi:hypothetical protein
MYRLDIIWVIVAPCSSHTFGVLVIGNDIVVVREFFMADRAYATLFSNLAVHQLPQFGGRSEFSIAARMMRIFDPLNSESNQFWFGEYFSPAAGNGSVNWANFIGTEFHGVFPDNHSICCTELSW